MKSEHMIIACMMIMIAYLVYDIQYSIVLLDKLCVYFLRSLFPARRYDGL